MGTDSGIIVDSTTGAPAGGGSLTTSCAEALAAKTSAIAVAVSKVLTVARHASVS